MILPVLISRPQPQDCIPHRLQLPRRSHIGLQPVCLWCFCKQVCRCCSIDNSTSVIIYNLDVFLLMQEGSKCKKTASFSDAVASSGEATADATTTRSHSPSVPQNERNLRSSPLVVNPVPNNSPPPVEVSSQPGERSSAASPFSTASTIPMYTPPLNAAQDALMETVSDSGTRRPSVENMDFGVDMQRGWLKKKNGLFGWKATYVVLDQGLLRYILNFNSRVK